MSVPYFNEPRPDRYVRDFDGFAIYALDDDQHEQTCGYWYTVTHRSQAHTAFKTRAGLLRWLADRNLVPDGDVPAEKSRQMVYVPGGYSECCHMSARTLPPDWAGPESRQMDNARYTLSRLVTDGGRVTVHYANCNDHARTEYDRADAESFLDGR